MDFKGEWPVQELKYFKNDMKLLPDFISELEETQLFEEVEPYMKRLRYEYDHWDDVNINNVLERFNYYNTYIHIWNIVSGNTWFSGNRA